MNLWQLQTEQVNPQTQHLDQMSSREIVIAMNDADREVPLRVYDEIESIAKAVDLLVERMKRGGRVIYVGAGTSGRLGVLDASECPPTFGVSENLFQGIIAGGSGALNIAHEEAEDNQRIVAIELERLQLTSDDTIVALSASGRTPYCIAALEYAKEKGTGRVSLSCNKNSQMSSYAEVAIEIDTGPEVIMGSTRLKAGTAQKMVLNMLSTASMIRMGKVYKNLMVDMKPSNKKLKDRAVRMVSLATSLDIGDSSKLLEEADMRVKVAIIMGLTHVNASIAQNALDEEDGFVRKALRKVQDVSK